MPPEPAAWPDVVAVVPARDEADVIATASARCSRRTIRAAFAIVLVDDQSRDGTAAVAAQEAARAPAPPIG